MTTLVRRTSVAAVLLATACGGDATAPATRYPEVNGLYRLDATFDQLPATQASVTGTITFVQADRNQPTLTGSSNLVLRIGTSSGTTTVVRNVTVSEAGAITFEVGEPSASASWLFRGSVSGASITGTHLLSGSTGAFSGRFTAVRQ